MAVGGSYLDALGDPLVRAALDEIPQGFAYYDADDRCRLWNRRYAEMWAQWGLILKPGAVFIEMLRAGVAAGRYPQAEGREEAWIDERMAGRAASAYASEIEGSDGVCYRMEQRRTPDGGRITTVTDISELKRREREARRAQAYLDAVVENVPSMLIVKDGRDGRFQLLNRAGETLLGIPRDAFVGKTIHDVAAPARAELYVERDAQVMATGRPLLVEEETITTADGRELTLRTHKLPISDPEGAPLLLSVSEDITALKAATRALQQARDRAEAASLAKSEFLTNMSHEIRTPLNGVLGLAEILARTELDERQSEMIAMLLTSGQALNTLLSDILDLAKVEAGVLTLAEESFDLRQAATEAALLFEGMASAKGVRFRFVFDEGGPTAVVGDPLRLRQVIANLTSNAVKFTSQGEVAVLVRTRPASGGELDLKVTVRDTGPGFDEATRARLFGRFEQGDASTTRQSGGAGLGLSIAAQLAALMDGRIDCASAPGRGSVFIFSARLRLAEALAPATASANDRLEPMPSPLRVLLAEDHPTNQQVVALMLGDQVMLDIAADGRAAVRAFASKPYDLILMDTQMPVMDGLAAIREIRAMETARGGARTPVVSLTANAMPAQVEECRAAGADLHLAKPITVAGLIAAIQAALALGTQSAGATLSAVGGRTAPR